MQAQLMTGVTKTVIAAAIAFMALASPAAADRGQTCYGLDESNSIRCFDCMRRVWTGHRWQLVNTCQPSFSAPPIVFFAPYW